MLNPFGLKQLFRIISISSLLLIGLLVIVDQSVSFSVRNSVYRNIEDIPHRPYTLLLGTSKYTSKNNPNQFYENRLHAAKQLFDTQKTDYILLSGDNRTLEYNEPKMMGRDLKKMGIEEKFLFPDYAGFRTLDSVIRAKEVFQIEPMTIVSQGFHCERALFIAKYHHIDAICFVANDPEVYLITRLREVLARFLILWELWFEKAPHFLGNPEPLPPPIQR